MIVFSIFAATTLSEFGSKTTVRRPIIRPGPDAHVASETAGGRDPAEVIVEDDAVWVFVAGDDDDLRAAIGAAGLVAGV